MISILGGFIAGLIHVVSGPDHLAAIAPLTPDASRRFWQIGLRWGIGHSTGVVAVGLASLLLRDLLPIDFVSSWGERFVGVLLIGMGLWGIRKALRHQLHAHVHLHDGQPHLHFHAHVLAEEHDLRTPHVHSHAALGIGVLHGLAGSSHLLGVLPALALPSVTAGFFYLIAFGLGTIVAMSAFSSAMGLVTQRMTRDRPQTYRGLMYACSFAAMGVGGYWLVM
jgi:sulfite exporter TauE/SafE